MNVGVIRTRSILNVFVGNLCIFAFSIILALIVFELVLRIAPLTITKRIQSHQQAQKQIDEIHPKGLYVLNQQIGWTLTPHFSGQFQKQDFNIHVRANADGIRNAEVIPKEVGTYRILGLGDSFAFGWGVEEAESFFKKMEQKLNSVEVINAGIPGFGTYEAFQLLKSIGMSYEPDLVILAFYEGNDYKNNATAPRNREITNGYLRDIRKDKSVFHQFLVKNSVIAGLADAKFSNLKRKRVFEASVQKTKQLLFEMKQLLEEKNIPLMVVLIPDQDVAFYKRSSLLKMYDQMASGMNPWQARSELKAFCEKNEIHFFQLSSLFENSDRSINLRLKDTHFNAEGHDMAADEIVNYLELSQIWKDVMGS